MASDTDRRVHEILAWLERRASKTNVDGMARYGIVAPKVFGVSVGVLRDYAKRLGRDHALALALWRTGWYEARMLGAFVDDPDRVTMAQMDRWARDFDNWAICDTVCFHLFDKTAHRWDRIRAWERRPEEFARRAAFALIASVGAHDKAATDAQFRRCFPMIRRAATDERAYVKKGVSWALRVIGNRSLALHTQAKAVASSLKRSTSHSARWIGSDALRDLSSAATAKRLARRRGDRAR
jgi:3-methyladenine DNA glycosylase AlkD